MLKPYTANGRRQDEQLWTTGIASARGAARTAQEIEAAGWDGMLVVDSQNFRRSLCLARFGRRRHHADRAGHRGDQLGHPSRRRDGHRDPSVNRVSNGRAVLGIGRGDSALAHLGRAPARLAQFERYLRQLQTYLRGEWVSFDDIDIPHDVAPPMSELELADAPPASRIGWIAGGAKVPVEVAASGPSGHRPGGAACRARDVHAGRRRERMAWGIELARQTRKEAGLDPDGIAFGAYVTWAATATGRQRADWCAADYHPRPVLGDARQRQRSVSTVDRAVLEALRSNYDMRAHTRGDSREAGMLAEAFIDRFAIAGPPERCIERLQSLAALGLDKVAISGGMRGASTEDAAVSRQLVVAHVLPGMRG